MKKMSMKEVSVTINKAKTPTQTQGFIQFQMLDPSHHQLVNLVMIPNIDRDDFIFSKDEFKRNPVLQVDRDAI